jgi:hypothetical protein
VFRRVGIFDEDLIRNQDDEFNHRLIRNGGSVLLLPGVRSYYRARSTLPQLARMQYQYGYFKPLVVRKIGRVMTLRQLVPSAFVLAAVSSAALALFWPFAALAFKVVMGSYLAALAVAVAPAARRRGPRAAVALAAAFATMHASYGLGFLHGTWDHLIWRRRRWRNAAALPLSR